MPELAHVQVFRRLADQHALGKRIVEVRVFDDRPLRGFPIDRFKRRLRGHVLHGTRRHGKWLFLGLDGDWLALHFGMTGRLEPGSDGQKPPAHAALLLRFGDGSWVAFVDRRRLGRVSLTRDIDAFLEENELGPDAVATGEKRFVARLAARRGMVKPALMDQSLVAGLGNHMVDEALFEAGIHPKSEVGALDEADLRRIHRMAKRTTKHLVSVRAKYDELPEDMLLRHRSEENARCPRCDVPYERAKVGGRTTVFCPQHQRLRRR